MYNKFSWHIRANMTSKVNKYSILPDTVSKFYYKNNNFINTNFIAWRRYVTRSATVSVRDVTHTRLLMLPLHHSATVSIRDVTYTRLLMLPLHCSATVSIRDVTYTRLHMLPLHCSATVSIHDVTYARLLMLPLQPLGNSVYP